MVEKLQQKNHTIQIIQWFRTGNPDEKKTHQISNNRIRIPYPPWKSATYCNHIATYRMLHVWYIYLQNWVMFKANVGKYSNTMGHMMHHITSDRPVWCRSFTRLGLMLFMMHTACRTNFTCSLINAIEI